MMANPKIWEMTNGQIMHVKTPATIRASDLGAVSTICFYDLGDSLLHMKLLQVL